MKLQLTTTAGTADIMRLVPTVTCSGNYKQCARTLEFGIIASATDANIPTVDCPLGGALAFTDDASNVLFSGWCFRREKATGDSVMDITAYDRGLYFKRNEAVYKFANWTPEAITRRVCADFGVTAGNIAETGVTISRNFVGVGLYQIVQTAYTLAAAKTGASYQQRFNGDALDVIERGAVTSTYKIEAGKNLMSATSTESIEDMVNKVIICDASDSIIGTQSDENLIGLYGLMQNTIKQSSGEDATAKAKKLLSDNGVSRKITVENLGDASLISGSAVIVTEPYTGLSGLFYIDEDVHTWKNGQYYNKLTLNFKKIMDEQDSGSTK